MQTLERPFPPGEPDDSNALQRPLLSVLRIDWEIGAYLLLLVAAAALRFWDLGSRAQPHDESLHAVYSYYLYAGRGYVHDPLMHGPFQFHAIALMFKLFGDSEFTARVPAAVVGTLIVLTPLLFRKWLGSKGTVLAALFLALSPSLLYYSRFAREDIHIALWTVLTFAAVWRYRDDGRTRWCLNGQAFKGLAAGLTLAKLVSCSPKSEMCLPGYFGHALGVLRCS